MEIDDDDTFIVVVGNGIDKSFPECLQLKNEDDLIPKDSLKEEVDSNHESSIKDEQEDEDDISLEAEEPLNKDTEEFSPDDTELSDDSASVPGPNIKKRTRKLKPSERHSYVESIKKLHPELRKNKQLLMDSLVAIMKETKPPPLPADYYTMDGIMFQCNVCSHRSESLPLASRHYKEKHGKRYLYCLACGVNFRRTTHLYKHEKICDAADADAVLRARAACLGRKSRARPYMDSSLNSKPNTTNLYKHEKICDAADADAVKRARAACLGHKGRARPSVDSSLKPKPKEKVPVTPENKKSSAIRKYGTKTNYAADALEEALRKIRSRKMTISCASKEYKIPLNTLHNKVKNIHPNTVGRPSVFSAEEENLIESHMCDISDCGVPLRALDLSKIIQVHLNSSDRKVDVFKDNLPGKDWGKSFVARHPELRMRFQRHFLRRGTRVNSEIINDFFDDLQDELRGVPPGNIYSFTEAGFEDDLALDKIVFMRDSRHPSPNSMKSSVTVVLCGNAGGKMIPPFLIFQGDHMDSDWLDDTPRGSSAVVTESGWLDPQSFDMWFKNHFLPRISKKKGTKILIGDCLSSHLTISTIEMCNKKSIKFICTPPNTGPLLQPIVTGFFDELESWWKLEVEAWKNYAKVNLAEPLSRDSIIQPLTQTFNATAENFTESLITGFKACGIYPTNREEVLKRLPEFVKSRPKRDTL